MNEVRKPSPEFLAKLRAALLPKPQPPAAEDDQQSARERWEERQREMNHIRRQQAIDAVWERTLQARADAEADASARGFHKARGDPDWNYR